MKKARAAADDAYRALAKMVNALALIYGENDYSSFIDYVNAEIAHYKREVISQKKQRQQPTLQLSALRRIRKATAHRLTTTHHQAMVHLRIASHRQATMAHPRTMAIHPQAEATLHQMPIHHRMMTTG